MFDQQQARPKRQRASESHTHSQGSIEIAHATLPRGFGDSDFGRQVGCLANNRRRWRLDLQAEWNRQILDDGQRLQQRRPLADDVESIEECEPVCTVYDLGRRAAEDAHLSGVGQAGARDQIDQHFRRRLIESEQRHLFAGNDDEVFDAKRTQRTVLFGHANKFDDRFSHESGRMQAGSCMMLSDLSMTDFFAANPPSAFIARWVPRVRVEYPHSARALDLAAGRGRHSLLMAGAGFHTIGIDIQYDALLGAKQAAHAAGLDLAMVCADLTTMPLPLNHFHLVVVTRYHDRALFSALRDALVPGGVLLYETFTERQREHGWGPTSGAHLLQPGELRMLTRGMDMLFDEEVYLPEAVARIAVRRRS